MLDFDKELEQFQPEREIDKTEDAIRNRNRTDLVDIMLKIMEEKKRNV